MFRSIHKIIASSISTLRRPHIIKYNKWIEPVFIGFGDINGLDVGTLTIYFGIPNRIISNNLCLIITKTIIEQDINIIDDAEHFVLEYNKYIDREFDDLEIQKSVLENLLPKIPYIFEIDYEFSNTPNISEYEASRVEYLTNIIDFTGQISFNNVKYSNNLFTPLNGKRIDGANYQNKHEQQELIFDDNKPADGSIVDGVRKAYTVNKTPTSTHVQKLNIWDLIYPLLLPPLEFEFTEQFDFHKPLYGFQIKGVDFLIKNESALLADEMGTGKTVQAIVAIRLMFRKGLIKSALVICPPSVLGSSQLSVKTGGSEGWDGHFFHWAPELTVTVVRGNIEQRKSDWNYPAHVYLTTYDIIRNDIDNGLIDFDFFEKYDCVVIDEAQIIKNINSGRSKAVRKLKAKYKWALTGTPIENKVDDVISIFAFLKPKLFSRKQYSPSEVKHVISPYFFRRLKRDVWSDLPQKIPQDIWLELDDDQLAAYNEALDKGRYVIRKSLGLDSEFQIRRRVIHLLQQLKQICNFAPNRDTSPKTEKLLELIDNIIQNDEKVLVYSQYIENGVQKLEGLFKRNGIKHVTYKGGMSDSERTRVVNLFKTAFHVNVFLGSVKAAGLGLTLTEASYVIHYDHWWNPAVMWQAEDRAHRHGQKNNVNIYSFWMSDTIEQTIKEKLKEKGLLIENVINSLAESEVEKMISTEEWLEMLGIVDIDAKKDKLTLSSEEIFEKIKTIDPYKFENISELFLKKLGYSNARVTKKSKDGGIDVYGSKKVNGYVENVIAQCKRTDNVGINVAREMLGIMSESSHISKGFIITSGRFSLECQRLASSTNKITLIDGLTFAKYIKQFNIST